MGNDDVRNMSSPVAAARGELAGSADHCGRTDKIEAYELPPQIGYWFEFQEKVPEHSLAACVRGADALLRLVGLAMPAYAAVLTLSHATILRRHGIPYLFWIVAAAAALIVLLPTNWQSPADDVLELRASFKAMVFKKYRFVVMASALAILGFIAAVLVGM